VSIPLGRRRGAAYNPSEVFARGVHADGRRGLRTHPWDLIRFTPAWGSEPPSVPAFSLRFVNSPGPRMDFDLLSHFLWYAGVFVALGVLNTLLAAGAFRVNLGAAEFPMDLREFWQRSAFAGFALAAYAFVAAFIALTWYKNAYWLFGILMIPYPVLAVYLYNWAYALDDLLEGFKIFLIHHLPPILVLLIAFFVFAFKVDGFVRFVLPA
jgi:hypothetical protein